MTFLYLLTTDALLALSFAFNPRKTWDGIHLGMMRFIDVIPAFLCDAGSGFARSLRSSSGVDRALVSSLAGWLRSE